MGFISNNRSQINLLGYSIEDFAKADLKCRFVVDIVSRLDLGALFARYSDQGGDSYAPDVMLSLWFYAYSNGITETRVLEDLCKFDTRYMYISGNLHPDHTTLSRFRKSNLDLISNYFVQIVLIASEERLTDFKNIAIDGTKIQAKSSARHSYTEDQLNERIASIRRDIAYYMQQCNFAEQGSDEEFDLESLRIEKERLEKIEQQLLKRKEQIQKRKEELKPQHRENHKINLKEPDARFAAKHNGLNYNAQAATEDAINLITAADVVNEPNDQGQFIPMQQKVEKNIPKDPNRRYTGDAGYHNLDDLEELENNNIDAIIADPNPNHRSIKSKPTSKTIILKEERQIERNDFIYHPDENCYECPAGDKLMPVKNKGKSTVYRASLCEGCQLSKYCLGSKKKIKQIHRSHKEDVAERMSKRLQTEQAKQRMKMRATSVEPVFGNLKHNLKFRRFSLRGLTNVRGEFNLMCIGHNLNVLFKWMQPERFAAILDTPLKKTKQYIAISKNILVNIKLIITRYFVNPHKIELQNV